MLFGSSTGRWYERCYFLPRVLSSDVSLYLHESSDRVELEVLLTFEFFQKLDSDHLMKKLAQGGTFLHK